MSNPTTDEVRGAANAMFAAAQAEVQQPPQPPQPSPEQIQAHMARQAADQRQAAAAAQQTAAAQQQAAAAQQTIANNPQGQQRQQTAVAPQPGDPNYPAYADAQGWARHLTPEEVAYIQAQPRPPRNRAEYAAAQQADTARRSTGQRRKRAEQPGQNDPNWWDEGAARRWAHQRYVATRETLRNAQNPMDSTTGQEVYGRPARTWWDAILLAFIGSIGLCLLFFAWRVGAQANYDLMRDFGSEGWIDKEWRWTLYALPIFISGFQWLYVPPLDLRDLKGSIVKLFTFWPINAFWIGLFLIDTGSNDKVISALLLGKSLRVLIFGDITFADGSILYNGSRFVLDSTIALGLEIIFRLLLAQTLRGIAYFTEGPESAYRTEGQR